MTPVLVGKPFRSDSRVALREIGRVGAGGGKVENARRTRAGFVGRGRLSGSRRPLLLTTVCVNPGAKFFKMRPWILLPPSPTCFSGSGRNGGSRTRCSRSGRDCTPRRFHCSRGASGSRASARSSCSRPGWRLSPSGSCAMCGSSGRSCRHSRCRAGKRALMPDGRDGGPRYCSTRLSRGRAKPAVSDHTAVADVPSPLPRKTSRKPIFFDLYLPEL